MPSASAVVFVPPQSLHSAAMRDSGCSSGDESPATTMASPRGANRSSFGVSPKSIATIQSWFTKGGMRDDREVLSRRNIYYKRLVGDAVDLEVAQARSVKNASWLRMASFLIYAMIANVVIILRTDIHTSQRVNRSLRSTLESRIFDSHGVSPKKFNDITYPGDIRLWLQNALMPITQSGLPLSHNYSLSTYNRIVPQAGVCADSASITLTLRKAQTTLDYMKTTTARFASLYREAWLVDGVGPGSYPSDDELKSPVDLTYTSEQGDLSTATWAYSPPYSSTDEQHWHGFDGQGGYVALWVLGSDQEATQYVHLQDLNAEPTGNRERYGICGEERISDTVTAPELFSADFLGKRFASLALEFTVYNANFQTLSYVTVTFTGSNVGLVSEKSIDIETFRLDILRDGLNYPHVLQLMEAAYLFWTLFWFLDFVHQVWRDYKHALQNVWCYINFVSIFASLMSLASWYLYAPEMNNFLDNEHFQYNDLVHERFITFQTYKRASAFAILTIWLRLVHVLGQSQPRVRLLLRTIGMAAGGMAIYLGYITVILLGFWSLALTNFSAYSADFVTPGQTFVSCFELFLGQVDVLDSVPAMYVKGPFKVLFLLFFFFISVQMFSAIINHSYNRVSEEMEEQFQAQKTEAARRRLQRKLISEKLHRPVSRGARLFKKVQGWFCVGKPKDAEKENSEPALTSFKSPDVLQEKPDVPAYQNVDDSELTVKLDRFIQQEKRAKAPESMRAMLLFMIFAISYCTFLYVNIPVTSNARIQAAMRGAIESKGTMDDGRYLRLGNVAAVADVATWMTEVLPQVIFESTSPELRESAIAHDLVDADTWCLNSWNCLVTGTSDNKATAKLLRVTQRRAEQYLNKGTVESSNTIDDSINSFTGGLAIDGVARSELMVGSRRPREVIYPDSVPTPASEDLISVFDGSVGNITFCDRVQPGDGGYMQRGGIECFLDINQDTFRQQLESMYLDDFYSIYTASMTVDFVAYNANAETLVYSRIVFTVDPSGIVHARTQLDTLYLMHLNNVRDNHTTIAGRCFAGIVYFVLVIYFLVDLLCDLCHEQYRRYVNEKASRTRTTIEYFTRDIMNTLDVVSITISLVSLAMFFAWMYEETKLQTYLTEGKLGELLDYCGGLATSALWYTRLSAINMLVIFVRPLKFARENERVAKLNETLVEARTDISWFVVVFGICMFAYVMFAYLSFGAHVEELSNILTATTYCFYYVLGSFNYGELHKADPVMAGLFFVSYMLMFYLVFTNIFLAIIDRHFVTAEAPKFNLKRALKPIFGNCFKCIQWDEDYVMEEGGQQTKKQYGPLSRRDRVKATHEQIELILQSARDNVCTAASRKNNSRGKYLSDVCEMDERLYEVMHWGRVEAKQFVETFQRFQIRKHNTTNDKLFVLNEVMPEVHRHMEEEYESMSVAERRTRHAIQVNEQHVEQDQRILASYINVLETRLSDSMKDRRWLMTEVEHLNQETHQMRYTQGEDKAASKVTEQQAGRLSARQGKADGAAGSAGGSACPQQATKRHRHITPRQGKHRPPVEHRAEATENDSNSDSEEEKGPLSARGLHHRKNPHHYASYSNPQHSWQAAQAAQASARALPSLLASSRKESKDGHQKELHNKLASFVA